MLADLTRSDDRKLVELALAGHETAYREIVTRHQGPVFSLVFRMVRDREVAEEIAQEAFLRAFQALESFDRSLRLGSWLFKIANNLAIDHLRRRRIDTVPLNGVPGSGGGEGLPVADPGESPLEFVENRELGSQLETALGSLRPEYRAAVLLRHVEGHSYEEIAGIMELPLGTVKSFLHRARHELREQLQEAGR